MTEDQEQPGHWSILEIAPTSDAKVIRRAYTRLLRTIDVDQEPERFIALRAAYEAALNRTFPTAAQPSEPMAEMNRPNPAPVWMNRAEVSAIHTLLQGIDSRADIAPRLAALTETMVALSHASNLTDSEAIEHWLAATIVNGLPRSNPMLESAIRGFRWEDAIDDYNCPNSIRYIVERHQDLLALRKLEQMNPAFGLAWRALTEGGVDFDKVHPGCMTTLLGIIRYQRPHLSDDIDIDAFRRWNAYLEDVREEERRHVLQLRLRPEKIEISQYPRVDILIDHLLMISGAIYMLILIFYFARHSIIFAGIVSLPGIGLIALALDRRSHAKRYLGGPE